MPPSHGLLVLPDEVLRLVARRLSAVDASSLSRTCWRLRELVRRDVVLWRSLMSSEFPDTAVRLQRNQSLDEDPRDVFARRFAVQKSVLREIEALSETKFHSTSHDLSLVDSDHFLANVDPDATTRGFVLDALMSLLHRNQPDKQLTQKHYARRLIHFVRCAELKPFWRRLKEEDPQADCRFDYVEGLVRFAQWFQPHEPIDLQMVKADVEDIATRALRNLRASNPRHPAFVDRPRRPFPNSDAAAATYTFDESVEAFDALNRTLYDEMGFAGSSSNYSGPADSFVDKVLSTRHGIQTTLCLLYADVAATMGLEDCRPVNSPGRFALLWKGRVLVDAFKRGTRTVLPEDGDPVPPLATPLQVFKRMTRNLLYIAEVLGDQGILLPEPSGYPLILPCLELQQILGFDDDYGLCRMCSLYLDLNMNLKQVMGVLDSLKENVVEMNGSVRSRIRRLREKCVQQMEDVREEETGRGRAKGGPKTRSMMAEMEAFGRYAVGMVMRHRESNYQCVVYGWDPKREAGDSGKAVQPFYNVLVNDGSIRCEADEDLAPAKPHRITNAVLGKYFSEFDDTVGYIANRHTSLAYPEDGDVALRLESERRRRFGNEFEREMP